MDTTYTQRSRMTVLDHTEYPGCKYKMFFFGYECFMNIYSVIWPFFIRQVDEKMRRNYLLH